MNLWFRLLWTILASLWRSRVHSFLGPAQTPFRMWLNDLDAIGHMNNGRYLTLMDLARTDLLMRSGMVGELRRRRWYPVIVAETIRFLRPIHVFERFEITTTCIGWDERDLLLEQVFIKGNVVCATAIVKAQFREVRGGRVNPEVLFEALGLSVVKPALPPWVVSWSDAQSMKSNPPALSTGTKITEENA